MPLSKHSNVIINGELQCFDDINALIVRLKKDPPVVSLDLSTIMIEHAIGPRDTRTLAAWLIENKTLKTLNLYRNEIGREGTLAIAAMLEKNTTLTDLSLGLNVMGDFGAVAIAAALERNVTLKTLNLRCNCIESTGSTAIATMLERNASLINLDFYGNGGDGRSIPLYTLTAALRPNIIATDIATKLLDSVKSKTPFTITSEERKFITTPLGALKVLNNFLGQNHSTVLDEELQNQIRKSSRDGVRLLISATAAMADDRVHQALKHRLTKLQRTTIRDELLVSGTDKHFGEGGIAGEDGKPRPELPDPILRIISEFTGPNPVRIVSDGAAGRDGGGGGGGGRG